MSVTEAEAGYVALSTSPAQSRSQWLAVWMRLRRHRPAFTAAILIGLFVMVALLAPVLAPHNPSKGDLSQIRPDFVPGPSAGHPLGLDQQGRDELSRLIYGARNSLLIAVSSVSLGVIVGVLVGSVAGVFGGWVDTLAMRLMDVMLAIPGLLFAIGLVALLGNSLPSVMIAIGVSGVPIVARLARGAIISERERDYILAARAIGATRRRLVVRHMLPNSMAPVVVAGTLALGGAILDSAGLAFLGLGPNDPSVPEWGRMLGESQGLLATSPQLVLFPAVAIVVWVLAFNVLGEALRDALDPKLDRRSD